MLFWTPPRPHFDLDVLAALVPPDLIDTLTEDPYVGGTTVHAYLSAPGAVALPAHPHGQADPQAYQKSDEEAGVV
tara:strand:+ start:198 stop:422 length:225 start_codon:yes stop_codon:yes gene_type:complete